MTDQVRTFGNTAGSNNVPGGLFAEGLLGSLTTDNLRQLQAAIRNYANGAEWFSVGDLSGPATTSYLSATSFRVVGVSLTSRYHVGRRVRATGAATGIVTGSITASTVNGSDTDVTVEWDSGGQLESETLLIELGINSAVGSSVPASIDHALAVIGALALTGDLVLTGNASISGTLTGSGVATFPSVTTTTGPFTLLSNRRQVNNGPPIPVPEEAKRAMLKVFGAGGGGASGASSFGGSVAIGSKGSTFTVASGSALEIVVPGGVGGGDPASDGNQSGREAESNDAIEVSGSAVISNARMPNAGADGGQGAGFGSSGSAGHYAEVWVDVTGIDEITLSGGTGGAGGNVVGEADGGRGGRAGVIAEFWG